MKQTQIKPIEQHAHCIQCWYSDAAVRNFVYSYLYNGLRIILIIIFQFYFEPRKSQVFDFFWNAILYFGTLKFERML